MNAKTGEIVGLERSAEYWMARAARHRRLGDRRRAAALLRHALAIAPADGELRMEYAKTLQEMECYEASNRAAFAALPQSPRRYACYGLIGRNMLALGYEQEAMDAFSRYLLAVKRTGAQAEFDSELDELESYENEPFGLRARHETQMDAAGRHLAGGDVPGARRALERARPARMLDDRFDSLNALLRHAEGDAQGAVRSAKRAVRHSPYSVRARCTLASVAAQAGQRTAAASALLAAAARCQCAQDEQLVCLTAATLGMPQLALPVLRRSLKSSPDRLPALFNMGVALLMLGRLDAAEPYLQRCRDLDPADVPARMKARTVRQWRELALTPRQVRLAARTHPFYPLLSPAESNECLATLARALGAGLTAFAARLQADEPLYDLLLYMLGTPENQLGKLLPPIAGRLPRPFAERLLREALVQPTPDEGVKRYAAAALLRLGAKPPFVVWHAGRIAEIDPLAQAKRGDGFSRAMLLRRLAALQRHSADPRLMTHTLRLLYRLGPHRRVYLVRDVRGVFRAALRKHYRLTYGLPDTAPGPGAPRHTAEERRRVRLAFRLLCRLEPIPARKPGR